MNQENKKMGRQAGLPSNFYTAMLDIVGATTHWRFWVHLAVQDIVKQYRRTLMGPWWTTVSTGITVFSFGYIASEVFQQARLEYLTYYATGFILFSFISACISESCVALINAEPYLRTAYFSKLSFCLRVILRNIILFMHNFVIILIALIFNDRIASVRWADFLLNFSLLVILLSLLSFWLAAISARYRDVPTIIANLMSIAFFLTPIIWSVDSLTEETRGVVLLNPLASLLDTVRAPLMGESSFDVAGLVFWLSLCAALLLFSFSMLRHRRHIGYWV
jgi:lipopolysaccharide transport system permease protein